MTSVRVDSRGWWIWSLLLGTMLLPACSNENLDEFSSTIAANTPNRFLLFLNRQAPLPASQLPRPPWRALKASQAASYSSSPGAATSRVRRW